MTWIRLIVPLVLLGGRLPVPAAPVPYAPDEHTLFLFHFDEPAGGSTATNSGLLGTNACTVNMSPASTAPPPVTDVLGAAGYPGFGNAAAFASGRLAGWDGNGSGAYDGDNGTTLSADRLAMSGLNMGNGGQTPWTIEALIRPSITNANQEIVSTDSSAGTRGFQFRLNMAGQLELNLISAGINPKTRIPADGPHAFVPDAWFHVAATYDGTNIVLYWTRLSASVGAANAIGTNAAAVGAAFGAAQGPLTIGNENRGVGGEHFQGSIDEVRISRVARSAAEMPNPAGVPIIVGPSVSPAGDPVYAGTVVTFSATVSGAEPLLFLWRTDGATGGALTNIPGANTNRYTLDTTGMPAGAYRFDLVATNALGSTTSSVATLNLTDASGPVVVADTVIAPPVVFEGDSVLLSASFTGNDPISYQWHFEADGGGALPIPDATNTSHTIASAQLSDTGRYFLMAFNDPPGLGRRTNSSTPATLTVSALVTDSNAPAGLMVDLLALPDRTTVADTQPEFTWIFAPARRGENQAAYEMIVASSAGHAAAGNGDVWDSGQVLSAESVNVAYGGPPLARGSTYYWRVRTWGTAGSATGWSAPQAFTIEATSPPSNARSIRNSSANPWSGRYMPRFDTAVTPAAVVDKGGGNFFIDFGRDGFGYITLRLDGGFAGQTLTVRFGEAANGTSVNTAPGGTIRYASTTVALQSGDLTYEIRSPDVSGDGINVDPWAGGVVLPFRYVELLNCPGPVTAADIRQHVLHYPFDDTAAEFASSDGTLDAVWELCRYSMKATSFCGAYVDGDRERLPYEADAYINQLGHYGVDREYTLARYTYEYLLDHPTWPTEWRFHFPLMAWADYLHTGNAEALAANYASLTNQLFLSRERASDGLFIGWLSGTPHDIVDWPAGERDGYVLTTNNTVVNAFHYKALRLMSEIATVLGKAADATNFAGRADRLQTAFNSVFWNAASNLYRDGETTSHISAHANFFPMAFGLVPGNRQASVLSYLKAKRMAPSVYGAQYLLEALFEGGEADHAIGLMADRDPAYKRHWWNMLAVGSTIAMEAWDISFKSNLDWNHAWGAAPANIIPRYVLGLKPLTPGFGRVEIRPQMGQALSHVRGVVPTVRGPVFIQATNAPGHFQLLLNLPGNMAADVVLPTFGAANPVALVDGRTVAGAVSNATLTVTNLGSGPHAVWLCTNDAPSQAALYGNWAAGWFGTNASNASIAGMEADPDGEGDDNLREFIAGTDPLDAASRFRIVSFTCAPPGPAMTATVNGRAGRRYTLQQALALDPASWIDAETRDALSDDQPLLLHDAAFPDATQTFLRVRVTYP